MQFFISFIMRLWCQTKPGAFFFCSALLFFFQFDKWTDTQRRRILTSLLERCSLSQQKFCCRKLQEKIPAEALDFTTKLPRVLSLYIFSFLDPRSLCRCAQVQIAQKTLKLEGKKESMYTKPSTDKTLTVFSLCSLNQPPSLCVWLCIQCSKGRKSKPSLSVCKTVLASWGNVYTCI